MATDSIVLSASKNRGIGLVLTAAILWGISGNMAQFLFHQYGFSPEWVTVIRLLLAGIILLGFAYKKEKQKTWAIWKDKQDRINIILFGILGALAVQYTYLAAINHGNAATATVLQYLAPALIACYVAIRSKQFPKATVRIAIILALMGTFLLVTGGKIHSLSISRWALFWGLASAVALASYTLLPLKLLAKWGSMIVVGWGMIIGGICFSFVHPPWVLEGQLSFPSCTAVIIIIIFGTVIPFYCFLESLKYLSAPEASILASVEPLAAAFFSVVWLKVTFGIAEWLGTFCIIITIGILSLVKEK